MNVLFAMPDWAAPSELWMQRMIEALEPDVAAVACWEPTESTWRGRIPAIRLRRDDDPTGVTAMREAVNDPAVAVVLIHYLAFALRFADIWQATDKPLYVHCHGYDVTWDRRREYPPHEQHFPAYYPRRVRELANRAILIANSHHTAAKLHGIGVPHDRVMVKHLGVPVTATAPTRRADRVPLNVLYLGRLVDFKGPDVTIRAFDKACEAGMEGMLRIAGDGLQMKLCREIAEKSPFAERIEFMGAVDAATGERLRAQADVFTAHNRRGPGTRQEEAFGVSIVEAMAAGLPIVSGRSGSLPEIVADGVEGLLFEPGDVDAHAAALLRLWREPHLRQAMGMAGWRTAKERFSAERERKQLREILGLAPRP